MFPRVIQSGCSFHLRRLKMLFLLELLSAVLRPMSSRAFSSSSCCCRLLSDFPSNDLLRRSEAEAGFRRSFSFIIYQIRKKKTKLVMSSSSATVHNFMNLTVDACLAGVAPALRALSCCPFSPPWQSRATSRCCCGTPGKAGPDSGPSSPRCSFLPADTAFQMVKRLPNKSTYEKMALSLQ